MLCFPSLGLYLTKKYQQIRIAKSRFLPPVCAALPNRLRHVRRAEERLRTSAEVLLRRDERIEVDGDVRHYGSTRLELFVELSRGSR